MWIFWKYFTVINHLLFHLINRLTWDKLITYTSFFFWFNIFWGFTKFSNLYLLMMLLLYLIKIGFYYCIRIILILLVHWTWILVYIWWLIIKILRLTLRIIKSHIRIIFGICFFHFCRLERLITFTYWLF